VNCTTQVQSSTVVVARSIHSFKLDRAAAATDDGHLSLSAALIPIATLHTIERGPERDQRARASPRGIFTSARKTTTWNISGDRLASTQCIISTATGAPPTTTDGEKPPPMRYINARSSAQ
jgi:hypothetical protein